MMYSEEFNKLFELSTIALVLCSDNSIILDCNPAFCNLLEYEKSELIGKNIIDDLTYQEDRYMADIAKSKIKNDLYSKYEKRYISKLGKIIYVNVTGMEMGDNYLGFIEDITSLKNLIAQLETTNEEYQKMVYVVSHDLQEPIRTVNNCLEFLEEEIDFNKSIDTQETYELIKHNLEWMIKLINSLLRYSRIGSSSPIIQNLNVKEIIDNIRLRLSGLIEEKKAIINYDCDLSHVKMDELHAYSLFQNLIHNALKYSPNPIINITCQDDNAYVKYIIEDNGIGIDPKYHDTIFLIFKRLERNSINGTGIGLAECKRIAQIYGGSIWLDSKLGKGTKFFVTLPKGNDDDKYTSS